MIRLISLRVVDNRNYKIFVCPLVMKYIFLVTLKSECDYSCGSLRRRCTTYVLRELLTFSSSPKPLHGFLSNLVWRYPRWMSTKFVQIGVLPLFFRELWVIFCEIQPLLKKSSSPKPLARKHSYLVCEVPRGSSY